MSDKPLAIYGVRRTAKELVDGTIRVNIDIEPANRRAFYDLLGEIDMPVALAPLDPTALKPRATKLDNEPELRPVASLAQRMHVTGYFRNPNLWRALHISGIYTLQQHKAFVESMTCLVRGALNMPCHGDVCLHHCTSAAIAAAGDLQPENPRKIPHWYGVPLCMNHHRHWLHQGGATREDKEELLVKAVALMAGQAKAAIKSYIGIESLSEITEEMLRAFEEEIGLEETL